VATILFADDSANIREFLKQELEDEGYRVLLARDGTEAVDLVQSQQPDLAILDILMPQLNGLEAAKRIAAIDRSIRVILFTNNDELCMRDPRSVFATACIEKGDDFTETKRTIVSVLASRNDATLVRRGLPPIQSQAVAEAFQSLPE
jgi:two-component system alkaline phosphatase synthesis response regulator PhoP